VREFPIFVDHEGERLAAIVSVPDEDPTRGLVVLLPGTGLYDVIGSRLCVRSARRLAGMGFASVRLDYGGIGDSTGSVPTWSLADTAGATEQVRSVLGVVRRALGAGQFAIVGTCYGTRIGFAIARDNDCVGAVWLAAPVIDWGAWTRLSRTARNWPILSTIRSSPGLRRMIIAPLRRVLSERKATPQLFGALLGAQGRRMLFLYTEGTRDHFTERARETLETTIAAIPPAARDLCELRILEHGPLTAFDVLPPERQDEIVALVVEWVADSFGDAVAEDPAPAAAALAD
jgi:pimeloyl-ACP methyl ester carboxylesterase